MQLTPERRNEIDEMGLKGFLKAYKTLPLGHPLFEGETGRYLVDRLNELRDRAHAEWQAGHLGRPV